MSIRCMKIAMDMVLIKKGVEGNCKGIVKLCHTFFSFPVITRLQILEADLFSDILKIDVL